MMFQPPGVNKPFRKKFRNYCNLVISGTILAVIPIFWSFLLAFFDSSAISFDYIIEFNHAAKIYLTNVVVTTLYFSLVLIGSKKFSVAVATLLLVPFAVCLLIEYVHLFIFSARPNSGAYYAILATNEEESKEFFANFLDWVPFLFLVIIFLGAVWGLKNLQRFKWLRKSILVLFFFHFLLSVTFLISRKNERYWSESPIVFSWLAYSEYRKDLQLLDADCQVNRTLVPKKEREVHIVVIGESTSKHHMSLYGYHRNTTPCLDSMKDSMVVFENAISPIVHTLEALQSLFLHRDCFTLIDSVRALGYETVWLSNQNLMGQNETPITLIAKRADRKVWAGPGGVSSHDENLLIPLHKELKAKKAKVIFLHLAGTHIEYYKRYPQEFSQYMENGFSPFGPHADAVVNHYDNATLYQDYILSRIIKLIQKENYPATVTYFSDHGDEVYDFRNFHGHSQVRLSKYMRDIPLFIYANAKYQKTRRDVWEPLESQSKAPTRIGDFDHLLYSLFENTPIKQYSYKSPVVDTIKEAPKRNSQVGSFLFRDKIWVHRVNGVERFREVQDSFRGFEIDLIYSGQEIMVGHPGSKKATIPIWSFFQAISAESDTYWWCDLKNMNSENADVILSGIIEICQEFGLNQTFLLLETTSPDMVPLIEDRGFYASYYLSDLSIMNLDDRNKALKDINSSVVRYRIKMISQSIENYSLMKENFPELNKAIWFLTMKYNKENQARVNAVLNQDPTVQVALVHHPSRSWQ